MWDIICKVDINNKIFRELVRLKTTRNKIGIVTYLHNDEETYIAATE